MSLSADHQHPSTIIGYKPGGQIVDHTTFDHLLTPEEEVAAGFRCARVKTITSGGTPEMGRFHRFLTRGPYFNPGEIEEQPVFEDELTRGNGRFILSVV